MKNTLINKMKPAIAISGLLFFILAGCNNKTSQTSATHPKTDTVIIDQMKFVPVEITISKGDTVLFINRDIVAHNATEVSNSWASPTLNSGDSWSLVPEKDADYFCSIHIVMKGKILIK